MTGSSASPGRFPLRLRSFETVLTLPPRTEVLRAPEPEPLDDVRAAVLEALAAPRGCAPLTDLCREVLAQPLARRRSMRAAGAGRTAFAGRPASSGSPVWDFRVAPTAVVVISDNTRPVPYSGEEGILWPLVESLLVGGFPPDSITLLVATGTHRVLSEEEMWALAGPRVRQAGVNIHCHDALDSSALASAGHHANGDEVLIDGVYMQADLRILTGLVEPHLMAGVSGGRKSICPGLLGLEGVREFHAARTLAHPRATGLVLDGNPCHELALEVARMARPDLILNVTARQDGRVAGVFAGDMEQAHLAAVEHLRGFVEIPLERRYPVVVTHGGMVGVNHYQAEKAAEVAARALMPGGFLVVVADTTEPDPVGTGNYRLMLELLVEYGPDGFLRTITADEWEFVHDQWGAQVWARLLLGVPRDHVLYFSPQTPLHEYAGLPCADPRGLLSAGHGFVAGGAGELVARFVSAAVAQACLDWERETGSEAVVAYLADGPHGIPVGPAAGDRR